MYTVNCDQCTFKKRSNAIDDSSLPAGQGDMQFRRWEYWGFGSLFVLHYTGDHTAYNSFSHRSSKDQQKPFIRSAPFIKEKVHTCIIMLL